MAIAYFPSSLCFLALLGAAYGISSADERFFVEGEVYCDTCRAQFITRVSQLMEGATVRLECRAIDSDELAFSVDGETDKEGVYRLPVDGDRQEDDCEVTLVKSVMPGCNEIPKDPFKKPSARVSLTANNGMATPVRAANPLGFLRDEPLPECAEVLRELGMTPNGLA